MTTKKEKESMPATDTFTFKVRGIVKAVLPTEYVGQHQTEKNWLVISQKWGDPSTKYHPTILVIYMGDKWVAIHNGQRIEEWDEIETTYTPTIYEYERDDKTNYIANNTWRAITIINKANWLFANVDDDLPF